MKKIAYIGLLALVLTGCKNAQKDEIAIQKEVLAIHDKVMGDDQKLEDNKMKIDTLIKKADSLKINKKEATDYSNMLNQTQEQMSDWMGKLDIDNTGKNHDDIMKYWEAQKMAGEHIDSLYTAALSKSDIYLQNIKK